MTDHGQFSIQARKFAQVAALLAASFGSAEALATETLPPIPTVAGRAMLDTTREHTLNDKNAAQKEEPDFKVESFTAKPVRKNPDVGQFAGYPASEMLKQVAERMPNWRDYFNDAPTTLHENIHHLHAYLRTTYGELPQYKDTEIRHENGVTISWNAVQPVWLGDGRVAMVKDPDNLHHKDILPYVPESLRRSRTSTYLENSGGHEESNILNEHAAYLLDAEYSVKIHDYIWKNFRNQPDRHVIDAADGAAEFIPYSLAIAEAIESTSGNYKTPEEQKQALAVIKELCERSAAVYKEALDKDRYPMFTATQRDYLSNLRDNPDAAPLREFAKKTYGEKWFNDLVGGK